MSIQLPLFNDETPSSNSANNLSNDLDNFNPTDFDSSIRRIEHKGETYYSLVDVMAWFSDTKTDARYYWRDTKKRLKQDGFELGEKISQLKLEAADGKKYATDCTDAETILRIVQSIPSPKAEPIRLWFARVAKERMEENANPELGLARSRDRAIAQWRKLGMSETHINERLESVIDRNHYTDALKKHVKGINYPQATNQVYRGTLGRDANQLRQDLTLKKGQNIRDHLGVIALSSVHHAEVVITELIRRVAGDSDTIPLGDALDIMDSVSAAIGLSNQELMRATGIDIVTGKPLLGTGTQG